MNKNIRREGSKFSTESLETCSSGGNRGTLLPPEVMFGDGDDRLRLVGPYVLRGSIQTPDGVVRHQLEPLRPDKPRFFSVSDAQTEAIGIIVVRTALN